MYRMQDWNRDVHISWDLAVISVKVTVSHVEGSLGEVAASRCSQVAEQISHCILSTGAVMLPAFQPAQCENGWKGSKMLCCTAWDQWSWSS